jgi:hypothetical protein
MDQSLAFYHGRLQTILDVKGLFLSWTWAENTIMLTVCNDQCSRVKC